MLKLQQLKQKQQQQQQQAAAPATENAAAAPAGEGNAGGVAGSGMVLNRTNSKELLEARTNTPTTAGQGGGIMSLRKAGAPKKGKVKPVELRVQKDVAELETIPGVEADFPDPNNLMTFFAKVCPNEGLYQGATFKFKIEIDNDYPYKAPRAECQTLVYHPNIDWEGHVCLNILRDEWKPILTLSSVLLGLLTLFLEPNPDDPLNKEAATLMLDKPAEFERNVKSSLRGGNVLGRSFPKLI
eukprot:TRINITY_DN12573_c0_g1_i1.p1 TRINITY_DN12573_c0_g1~~TRINITY_DN12573_c0_g1_i1.p1  ORF type:complete len:241 (+),score=74.29 TRINITY_DN12573_c0_g1_i1:100-822(+)